MGAMTLPLQQSLQFARALTAYGAAVLSDTPVILHRSFAPFGQVAFASRVHAKDVADTPVRILNGATYDPKSYRAAGFRQIITPAYVAELDLTAPDLHTEMHGKWRNRLVKGEANGLRVRELKWDGSPHWLFDAANTLAKNRKFRALPTPLLAAFARLNPDDALIFEAYDRGTPVAACLILRHGATATYQTAFATDTGLALHAPRVLLHHAAKRMAALNHITLDLGLVETDHAAGLARFKLGTGARLTRLGGTWIRLRGR